MKLSDRINAFVRLGEHIDKLSPTDGDALQQAAIRENPWFTPAGVVMALQGVRRFLSEPLLRQWTSSYPLERTDPKVIGVVMAGNIPLVGFHDFLTVLISGHKLKAKLSAQDTVLLSYLRQLLIRIEPRFEDLAQFAPRLDHIDAVIATGSDNTARYFEYYFRALPKVIRKNRSSCAVLSGAESPEQLSALGDDVFSYFGLGCRNVSKVYVPAGYDFAILFRAWAKYESVLTHSKYRNNYDYQKSIFLVNRVPFFDSGFILLKEDTALVSPVSVVYVHQYNGIEEPRNAIEDQQEKIQCVVSADQWIKGSIELGQAQFPDVSDYADGVDTLKFLSDR